MLSLQYSPVKRYDLTGYGANLFSDWTDPNQTSDASVVKADFVTTVGRTSREIVEVKSVIVPHFSQVVRTITIERRNSGSVQRTDGGRWQAVNDGTFVGDEVAAADVHKGVIDSLLKVQNIQEFGQPIQFYPPSLQTPTTKTVILMQPVTFDAEIAINTTDHQVLQGGSQVIGLDQQSHTAVPSTGIIGYICLTYGYNFSTQDLVSFLATRPQPPGGPMQATVNLGGAQTPAGVPGNAFRCMNFTVDPSDSSDANAVVITVHGLPTLPSGSAWTVALQGPDDSAPQALPATQSVPVVQPNEVGETHFADPYDIFRLNSSLPSLPSVRFLYGFLQDVTTQKTFLAQPFIKIGIPKLSLGGIPKLADPGMLLGISGFPSTSFPSLGSVLSLPNFPDLGSSLGSQSPIDKWFPSTGQAPTNLFTTNVAVVDLCYKWQYDAPPLASPPQIPSDAPSWVASDGGGIHITLGNPQPTWSIDIYGVALKLTISRVSNRPALWLEGSFHADSESLPTFRDLQVVYDPTGPLYPIIQFFTALQQLGPALGGNGASHGVNNDENGGPGLDVHFADGKLTIQDTFSLPDLPLGPGTISGISLDLGSAIDIINQSVDFLVGIGSETAPVHWIVDPLSGSGYLQFGVQSGGLAVKVSLGLGLGLAVDLAVASGSASVAVAFAVQTSNNLYAFSLTLTGMIQFKVLGGFASGTISLSCILTLTIQDGSNVLSVDTASVSKNTSTHTISNSSPTTATATGTARLGIHIHACWLLPGINWTGSLSFSHEFNLN